MSKVSFRKEWKRFEKTFGGVLKLVFVTVPGLLVPVANATGKAFGGGEFIPLGPYGSFSGVIAPVASAFLLVLLFSERDRLRRFVSRNRRPRTGRSILFLSVPLVLFLWGISGLVLVLIQQFGLTIFNALTYIASFAAMTLSLGLVSMKEYLAEGN